MFKFLKKKLKDAISGAAEEVEEEAKKEAPEVEQEVKEAVETPVEVEEPKVETEEPEVEEADEVEEPEVSVEEPEVAEEPKVEEAPEEPEPVEVPAAEPVEEAKVEPFVEEIIEKKEKKGFFGRVAEKVSSGVTTTELTEEKFEKLFWELEVVLLENGVAVEVIEKIKESLQEQLVGNPLPRGKIAEKITEALRTSVSDLFTTKPVDIVAAVKDKKPYVIVFAGINGSGKTTTIAKVAKLLQDNDLSCVMAAGDTFRAAAIHQLEEHANALNVRLIKHDYGSDPAAVAYDAVQYAVSKNIDAVLVDTAGRLHSNQNLMDEMRKVIRVARPDLTVFVGESITGNDCVEQAREFNNAVGIDGIILTKADVDEKGGAAISISYITGKPILYLGMGQEYGDLKQFDSEFVLESLGLES